MQESYPNKLPTLHWDTLNAEYPVHQFLHTGRTSEAIARQPRGSPEVIKEMRQPLPEGVEYSRDHNVLKELWRPQSVLYYGPKPCERFRFNKHSPWQENLYIYPTSRKLSDRVPSCTTHEKSEMRRAYEAPEMPGRLVTEKDQYKHPVCLPSEPPKATMCYKALEALDTTHEGFEKYLDPYLTSSRMQHRPRTARELSRASNSRDIITYYTCADTPWARNVRLNPKTNEWGPSVVEPKSMYDREKFKEDFREIRTHNKLRWVPGTFRTETDNYVQLTSHPQAQIHNHEEEVRTLYQRAAGQLQANKLQEESIILHSYYSENSVVGSGKPICAVIDPFVEKNRRLARKSSRK